MRDGLRKLRHAGTHLDSLSFSPLLLVPSAPFSACALFSESHCLSSSRGGHRSLIRRSLFRCHRQNKRRTARRISSSRTPWPSGPRRALWPQRGNANSGRRFSESRKKHRLPEPLFVFLFFPDMRVSTCKKFPANDKF